MKLRGDDAIRYLDALIREEQCAAFLIPEKLSVRLVVHARMARGGSMWVYRNDEYKVNRQTIYETRNASPKTVFSCDDLEGREFSTFAELRVALAEWRRQQ